MSACLPRRGAKACLLLGPRSLSQQQMLRPFVAAAGGTQGKPVFYDMVASNNAARIRLWIQLKGLTDKIDTHIVQYSELKTPEYAVANPLMKVPGMVLEDGSNIFEARVILNYVEDRFGHEGPKMVMDTPEERALVNLFVAMHDLYIASPNCTQPYFSHSQGSMYLPPYATKHMAQERSMDKASRAAKLADMWKHLTWLEGRLVGSPYMAGDRITHADVTWYPTCIYMKFMLPRVFGWLDLFNETEHLPKLTKWFQGLSENPTFAAVYNDIWDIWIAREADNWFEPILSELKDPNFKWSYP